MLLSLIFRKKQTFSIPFLQSSVHYGGTHSIDNFQWIRCYQNNKSRGCNKVHGRDNISVRMIKLCTNFVTNPLALIFQNSMAGGTFATQWKRVNIVPIHKKNDEQIVLNYRPVSLRPVCSKTSEKIIFNELFTFLRTKFCFRVFARVITHDISSFDCGVFLDESKAFDRVWHDGLLFKLKQNSVSGNLFQLITSFLTDTFQRVLLNGQISNLETIQAGVPQGSYLEPLFFLIYINDLTDNLNSNVKLFADDTSVFSKICDPLETANVLNNDLRKIREWADQ